MLKVIYDRNFREGRQREAHWEVDQELPDLEPHRIIELHATGEEKKLIEEHMGTVDGSVFRAYGDIARTIWLYLEHDYSFCEARGEEAVVA